VWKERWHDGLRLRLRLAEVARAIADLLDDAPTDRSRTDDRTVVTAALTALRAQYEATTYRPTGAGPSDVALTSLVPRLEWVGSCALDATAGRARPEDEPLVAEVEASAAAVLRSVAGPVSEWDRNALHGARATMDGDVDRLVAARVAATESALASLVDGGRDPVPAVAPGSVVLREVDPTYPTRMLAFSVEMLAEVALASMAAHQPGQGRLRRWRATVRSCARVAAGHATFHSVWFRNSVRGAISLAVAVAVTVVEVTTVEHGFWVVLGTLSVLRSNALGTGSTAVQVVAGTAVGYVIGSLVLVPLGRHDIALWIVLPLAVLVAAITPTMSSFAAGQAGFTVLMVIIFNIVEPVGSSMALVRFVDVMIGTTVSVAVGLLFWPRGASAPTGPGPGPGLLHCHPVAGGGHRRGRPGRARR